MKMSKRAKKIMTTLMAMSIATSMTVPVLADSYSEDVINQDGASTVNKDLDVTYSEKNTYIVTIPTKLGFDQRNTDGINHEVSVSGNLNPFTTLTVKLEGKDDNLDTSSGKLTLARKQTSGSTSTSITSAVSYTPTNGSKTTLRVDPILTVQGGNIISTTEAKKVTLTFAKPTMADSSDIPAGTYTATMNFVVECKDETSATN